MTRGLSIFPVNALVPNNDPYSLLLFQPDGCISADADGIRNFDRELSTKKQIAFFTIAVDKNIDVAICPEYSVSWSTLDRLINNPLLPHPGAVWLLGCESIQPESFTEFRERNNQIEWVFDEPQRTADQRFLDPLCLIFHSRDSDQNEKIVVVVQFKMHSMADHAEYLENTHMIRGGFGYILQNDENSIRLAPLVCADSLHFSHQDLPGYVNHSYLIPHIQLNPFPFHNQFMAYRNQIYGWGGEQFEFISCNWARGFQITLNEHATPVSNYGGSALYIKTNDLRLGDDVLEDNHTLGLYYHHCKARYSSMYCFNYSENVFYLTTSKVSQDGVSAVLRKRTGPRMIAAYKWDNDRTEWTDNDQLLDGFDSICNQYGIQNYFHGLSRLNAERFIVLSTGAIKGHGSRNWYDPGQLTTFNIDLSETSNRLTFVQHPCADAQEKRERMLMKFRVLAMDILDQEGIFPDAISDLSNGYQLRYPVAAGEFDCNICDADGKGGATVVYIGEQRQAVAAETYDNMAGLLNAAQRRRLVVWYRFDDDYRAEVRTAYPTIDEDPAEDRRHITRDPQ